MKIVYALPVLYCQLDCGITSERYFGHWFTYREKKRNIGFYTTIFVETSLSKPISYYIISTDIPLMAHVTCFSTVFITAIFFNAIYLKK